MYDYHYINSMLKGIPGLEEDSSELLRFLSMDPVVYLDSVQASCNAAGRFKRITFSLSLIGQSDTGKPGRMRGAHTAGSPALLLKTVGIFLSMDPVVYLDSVQAACIDVLTEQLRSELGVESTRAIPPAPRPLSQLYAWRGGTRPQTR